jgi:hypothetical protein
LTRLKRNGTYRRGVVKVAEGYSVCDEPVGGAAVGC